MSRYETERRVAVRAVEQAARLCEAVRRDLVEGAHLTKGDRSPVTVADFGAQALISNALESAFPEDRIVGEEETETLRREPRLLAQVVEHLQAELPAMSAAAALAALDRCQDPGGKEGRRWVVDPIDGTKGFLRGEQYAVALALLEEGEVVLGVLGCPRYPATWEEPEAGLGRLLVAVREGGTVEHSQNGEETRVVHADQAADTRQAIFCESVEAAHSSHDRHAQIASLLGVERPPLRIDSQCKYAAVARGDASIYLRLPTSATYREKIWDHAAGWIVVTEAGGRVTDAEGRELDFSRGRTLSHNRGIVATNGPLHEPVCRAVSRTA